MSEANTHLLHGSQPCVMHIKNDKKVKLERVNGEGSKKERERDSELEDCHDDDDVAF